MHTSPISASATTHPPSLPQPLCAETVYRGVTLLSMLLLLASLWVF